jgi:hypothetical protein
MKKSFAFFLLLLVSLNCNLTKKESIAEVKFEQRLEKEIKKIKEFIVQKPIYNSEIGFFVDMKIHSGQHRFFVYDYQTNKVIDKGLVAHGSGSETGTTALNFSNIPNSSATSLGKYAIGTSYNGQFGKAYKLYGLDKTNSKAFERFIVLHKYSQVPYEEQTDAICNSLGCPMVNAIFYSRLEKIIDASKKPILLTIYY